MVVHVPLCDNFRVTSRVLKIELCDEKTCLLHMQKQRRRSAV